MNFPYLEDTNAGMYSPLALAYIGDAVYEIYVRSHVLESGNTAVNKLHRASTHFVSARAQSRVVKKILPYLTSDEEAVYKRGRNAHSNTSAKNADIVDYRHATGFEALLGYLFISRRYERLNEIVNISFKIIDDNKENGGESSNE